MGRQGPHIFAGGDLIAADPNEISRPDGDPEDESQLTMIRPSSFCYRRGIAIYTTLDGMGPSSPASGIRPSAWKRMKSHC